MNIDIRGIGTAGGFGCGVAELTSALTSGKSRTKTVKLQSSGKTEDEIQVFLSDTSNLFSFISKRSLRRIDNYSKLALLGAFLAIEDSGIQEIDRSRMGIVIASGYGAINTTFSFLDSVMDEGKDEHASPIHFSNSVHNAAAAHISILMKIEGPSLTVSQFDISFPSALITACRWIEEKRVDSVLVGGVDVFSAVLGYCEQRLFKKDDDSGIKPFEFDKQTAIAGEGTAFFLLTGESGNDSGYGIIKDIRMGDITTDKTCIPWDAYLFIGADGNKNCGQKYPIFLDKETATAAYSPLYGSFPVATALDLAVAGISMKQNRIFASPAYSDAEDRFRVIKNKEKIDLEKICCLKISDHDKYSLITVGRK